ncbi:F-box protein At3g62230-like [Fagus crenata]
MAGKNLDMFKKLSDHLIVIIISMLPFKEAARTSVLSRRWCHIWRETRNIEFDERPFVDFHESEEKQATQRQGFMDFVLQWVQNYEGRDIEKFQLTCSKPEDFHGDIQRCIAFATTHNVKELGLDFSDPTWDEKNLENHDALFDLPLNVYGHVVLESLKLFSCKFLDSEFMNFVALKQVSLGWLELRESFIEALLVNCPLLESLSLKKCWNLYHLHVTGENLRLTSLVVDKCDLLTDWVVIEAPKLRYLKYSGTNAIFDVEIDRNHMEEADLDFGLEFEQHEATGHHLYKLLQHLYPIKVLTVCSYMLQFVPLGEEPLRMDFDMNIRHLIMKTTMHPYEFFGIRFFLNSCPRLETLTLNIIGPGRVFADYNPPMELIPDKFWLQWSNVLVCLHRSLKVVEVKGFKGKYHEVSLLLYLIFFGRVLERIDITVSKEEDGNGGNEDVYRGRAESLKTFKKASQGLQISIN